MKEESPPATNSKISLQSRMIALKKIRGSDFFPPFEGELPKVQGLRGLTRRHVTVLSTQDPLFEALLLSPVIDELVPFATEPALTLFRVYHSQSHHDPNMHPELLRLAGIADEHLIQGPPKQGISKAFQERLREDPMFRQKRATNGLDPQSRDLASPWYVEFAGPRWNSQTFSLRSRSELMRRTFLNHLGNVVETNREAIRLIATKDGCRIEFSFPNFLHVLAFNLDRFYEPLRRHRALCESLQKAHSTEAIIGRPPPVAAISKRWGFGERGALAPSDWPFVEKEGDPYSMYLTFLDPTTGLSSQYLLQDRAQLALVIRIVRRLRDRGLRFMLARFDADYITHCLPLDARNRLAGLTEEFQTQVQNIFDPEFQQNEFTRLFKTWGFQENKAWEGHTRIENACDSREDESYFDDDTNNRDEDDTQSSKSWDRDENSFDTDNISSPTIDHRIKLARTELVDGLQKISRLMIENCQAAVDAGSEKIIPVAFLEKKVWSSFFLRRLGEIALRREREDERKEPPLSWKTILDQMLQKPDPKATLGSLLDHMPENSRYADHQEKLLFAILDVGERRDKATARIEIYDRSLTEFRTDCENFYTTLAVGHPNLLPEVKAMWEQFGAWTKTQNYELNLRLNGCCEKVGVALLRSKALPDKAWPIADSLIAITNLRDQERETRAQLPKTWNSLKRVLGVSISSLGLDLNLSQRRRLLKLLTIYKKPSADMPENLNRNQRLLKLLKPSPKFFPSDDTRNVVYQVLRAGWPSVQEIEARQMSKNITYATASEIYKLFWDSVRHLQRHDDLASDRTERYQGLIEIRLNVGGWRQAARLGNELRSLPELARSFEEVFVDQLLGKADLIVEPNVVEQFVQVFGQMREWSDCKKSKSAADKEYARLSTSKSRLLMKIKFSAQPLLDSISSRQTNPL